MTTVYVGATLPVDFQLKFSDGTIPNITGQRCRAELYSVRAPLTDPPLITKRNAADGGSDYDVAITSGTEAKFTAKFSMTDTTALVDGGEYWIAGIVEMNGEKYVAGIDRVMAQGLPSEGQLPPPSVPSLSGVAENGTASAIVTWPAVTGASTYDVQRAPDQTGTAGTYATVSANQGGTSFTDSSLSAGTSYWYRVRANGPGGSSGYSTGLKVTTLGAEYFISPSGNDTTGNGTIGTPYATMAKAQTAARALIASAGGAPPVGGIAVTMRAGTYYQTSRLTFSLSDSGTSTRPVTWRAYGNETVRVSGGKRITGWTAVTSADANWARINGAMKAGNNAPSLFKASLGLSSYGDPTYGTPTAGGMIWGEGAAIAELFCNGEPMRLGRWPNRQDPPNVPLGMSGISGSTTTLTSTQAPPAWTLQSDDRNKAWAYVNSNGYMDELTRITALSGSNITLENQYFTMESFALWFATNLLEEVTAPKEYWIDRVTGDVYFYPPDGVNPDTSGAEVIVSQIAGPIVVCDYSSQYLTWKSLAFEGSQRNLMVLEGTHHTLSGCTFQNSTELGVGVAGTNITIDGCDFHGLGGSAIAAVGVKTLSTVSANTVAVPGVTGNSNWRASYGSYTVGSRAINKGRWYEATAASGNTAASGGPAGTGQSITDGLVTWKYIAEGSSGLTVSNCEIHDCARYTRNGIPGIKLAGTGHTIKNNEFRDLPWSAIMLFATGTLIELNDFNRCIQEGCDLGTVYTGICQLSNNEIRYNLFRNVPRPAAPWVNGQAVVGVYFDSDINGNDPTSVSDVYIHHNLFYRYGNGSTSVGSNGYAIENKGTNIRFENNLIVKGDRVYVDIAQATPGTKINNQFYLMGEGLTGQNVNADPGFLDETNGNFANREDGTLVLQNGAVIPFSSIGPA